MAEIAVEARRAHSHGFDWSAAIWAGVVAGIVFMLLEMIVNPLLGAAPTPWAPVRMMGAVLLGKEALPPPPTFDLGIFMAAMGVHAFTSIVSALVIAFVIRKLSTGTAILVGALLGVALYFLVFYLLTPVFPWFAMARGWMQIVFHLIFGAIVAWWYKARAKPADGHRVPA
jgi:hypothetical protein